MNEFIELINKDGISTSKLINKSFKAVNQNFKPFMVAMFKYILVGILFSLVLAVTAIAPMLSGNPSMIMTGFLIFFIGTLVGMVFLLAYGNKLTTGVYYSMIGKEDKGNGIGYFIKKSIILYLVVGVIGGIIVSIIWFILGIIFSVVVAMFAGVGGGILTAILGFFFILFVYASVNALIILSTSIKFEYIVAGNDMSGSIDKVLKIFKLNIKDLYKKSLGVLGASICYYLIVGLIVFFIATVLLGTSFQGMNVEYYYSLVGVGGFVLWAIIMIAAMAYVMFGYVLASGYYLNLSRIEGFEAPGLEGLTKVNKAKKANNENVRPEQPYELQEVVKTEQPNEAQLIERNEQIEQIEQNEAQEVVEVQEVQSSETEVQEVEVVEAQEVEVVAEEVVENDAEVKSSEAEVVEVVENDKI